MYIVSRLSAKKQKRNESRKRKIQALLEIAKSNDEDKKRRLNGASSEGESQNVFPINNESMNGSENIEVIEDVKQDIDYKALKSLLKERQKANEKRPSFTLLGPGVAAQYPLKGINVQKALFVQDLQHLLLKTLGCSLTYETRWCRLVRTQRISHVTFLVFDGLCANHLSTVFQISDCEESFHENTVEFVSPFSYDSSFHDELMRVPANLISTTKNVERNLRCNSDSILKPLHSMFSIDAQNTTRLEHNKDKVPRTQLLLSLPQMLAEGYPMPIDDESKANGYCFTKCIYKEVNETSPMFAIDCEMCITTERTHELVRISIVDEQLNILYDTLVKPKSEITNYLTKFSGVTESMLKDVTTRLEDVQKVIQDLLPDDAILCGQSLNFDLHAMKMMHPYVIDTSVIYNITGFRTKKTSLKALTNVFLRRVIQCGTDGHDSVEDGRATMELVQLKLSKGLDFGDVLLGGDIPFRELGKSISNEKFDTSDLLENVIATGKSVCIIAPEERLSKYTSRTEGEKFHLKAGRKIPALVQSVVENAIQHDMTLGHIPVKKQSKKYITIVNNAVRDIYNACADRALLVVAFTSSSGNGVCMVKLKDASVNTFI